MKNYEMLKKVTGMGREELLEYINNEMTLFDIIAMHDEYGLTLVCENGKVTEAYFEKDIKFKKTA